MDYCYVLGGMLTLLALCFRQYHRRLSDSIVKTNLSTVQHTDPSRLRRLIHGKRGDPMKNREGTKEKGRVWS